MMIFGYFGLASAPLLVAGFVYIVLHFFGATGWDLKVPPAVAIVLSWAMYGTAGGVVSAALFGLLALVDESCHPVVSVTLTAVSPSKKVS